MSEKSVMSSVDVAVHQQAKQMEMRTKWTNFPSKKEQSLHEDVKIEICPTENGHVHKLEQSEPQLWQF